MAFLAPLAVDAVSAGAVAGEAGVAAESTAALSSTQFGETAAVASAPAKKKSGAMDFLGNLNPSHKAEESVNEVADTVSHSNWDDAAALGNRVADVMSPRQFRG